MKTVMYLKRLKDFTPEVALEALKSYMPETDRKSIRLSINNLNLIKGGYSDDFMIKYVVSIGDALYQIVAIDWYKTDYKKVYVAVEVFQLCGIRRWSKKFCMPLEDFTSDFALDFFEETLSKDNSDTANLTFGSFNRIHNGIFDSNMAKYVLSKGYGLYQISAVRSFKNEKILTVIITYSQIGF